MADPFGDPWADDSDPFGAPAAAPAQVAAAAAAPTQAPADGTSKQDAVANPFSGGGDDGAKTGDDANPFGGAAASNNPFEQHDPFAADVKAAAAAEPAAAEPAAAAAAESAADTAAAAVAAVVVEDKKNGFLQHTYANGDEYEGNFVDDKRQGQGKLTAKNGAECVGSFENDVFVKGTMTDASKAQYTGSFVAVAGGGSALTGDGKLVNDRGIYTGVFKDGVLQGAGVCVQKDGGRYDGEFVDGAYHGAGVLTFADGDDEQTYTGAFKQGRRHGQGVIAFKASSKPVGGTADGTGSVARRTQTGMFEDDMLCDGEMVMVNDDVYTGQFYNAFRQGRGKYVCKASGDVYEGAWERGRRCGQGTTTFGGDGDRVKFDGVYKDDVMSEGTLRFRNGDAFEGLFAAGTGLPSSGTFKYHDGSRYQGQVNAQAQRHGKGVFTTSDNARVVTAEFVNGHPPRCSMQIKDGSSSAAGTAGGRNAGGGSYTGPVKWCDGDGDKRLAGYLRHGDGVMNYASADSFTGAYVDDVATTGTFTFANGDSYVGPFDAEGRRHTGTEDADAKAVMTFAGDGRVFTGSFVEDAMTRGRTEYANGDVFVGAFNARGECHGSGSMTRPGGFEFTGEYDGGYVTTGTIVYVEGSKDSQSPQARAAAEGNKTDAYRASTSSPADVAAMFAKTSSSSKSSNGLVAGRGGPMSQYSGVCSNDYRPDGEGKITWMNGDVSEGVYAAGALNGKGSIKFASGSSLEGVFSAGMAVTCTAVYAVEDDADVERYEGELNASGLRDGAATLVQYRDGSSFTGVLAEDERVSGKYSAKSGVTFEGAFNVPAASLLAQPSASSPSASTVSNASGMAAAAAADAEIRPYGEGVVTFADGTTYSHTNDDGDDKSFIRQVGAVVKKAHYDHKGVIAVAEAEITRIGCWPEMPAVQMQRRIPTATIDAYVDVQTKGAAAKLVELQDTRTQLGKELADMHAYAVDALAAEKERDDNRRAKYGQRWTLEQSEKLQQPFQARVKENAGALAAGQESDAALQLEHKKVLSKLELLVPAVEDLEDGLRTEEANDPARGVVITQLARHHSLTEDREQALVDVERSCVTLDIMPALMDGKSLDAATATEMGKIKTVCDRFESLVTQGRELVPVITGAYDAYAAALPTLTSSLLKTVTDDMTAGVAAFELIFNGLNAGCSAATQQKNGDFATLKTDIDFFVEERQKQRKELSVTLNLADLHESVIKGDVTKIKALSTPAHDDDEVDIDTHASESSTNAMLLAIKHNQIETIKTLAELGASLTRRDGPDGSQGNTHLKVALVCAHHDAFSTLIAVGADINRAEDEKTGDTLLHQHACDNDTTIIKLLIDNGADVSKRNVQGKTPLLLACADKSSDAVHALVEAGSSPNCPDLNGDTPLHFCDKGPLTIFLVQHGARIKGVTNKQKKKAVSDNEAATLKDTVKMYSQLPVVASDRPSCSEGDDRWVPDADSSSCAACCSTWGVFNRRHHCRRCGCVCCSACSTRKLHEPGATGKKFRVCDGCYNRVRHKK